MVEKSTKMASIANEQLIYLFWTKSAIWRYNNCQSYTLTTCTQRVPIFIITSLPGSARKSMGGGGGGG
jgi:hypothetical protein